MGISNEPKPPVLCERHDDWVDITSFGGSSRRMCVRCGEDPGIPADALYALELKEYQDRKAEYDRLTPRIQQIEAELRDAR